MFKKQRKKKIKAVQKAEIKAVAAQRKEKKIIRKEKKKMKKLKRVVRNIKRTTRNAKRSARRASRNSVKGKMKPCPRGKVTAAHTPCLHVAGSRL